MVLLCVASGNEVCQLCLNQFCKASSASSQLAGGGLSIPANIQAVFGPWDGTWATSYGALTLHQVSDVEGRSAATAALFVSPLDCAFTDRPVYYRGEFNWPTLGDAFGGDPQWRGAGTLVACGDAAGQRLSARFADQGPRRGSLQLIRQGSAFDGQIDVDRSGTKPQQVSGQKR